MYNLCIVVAACCSMIFPSMVINYVITEIPTRTCTLKYFECASGSGNKSGEWSYIHCKWEWEQAVFDHKHTGQRKLSGFIRGVCASSSVRVHLYVFTCMLNVCIFLHQWYIPTICDNIKLTFRFVLCLPPLPSPLCHCLH